MFNMYYEYRFKVFNFIKIIKIITAYLILNNGTIGI
jgi:hypothetical protein